MKNLRQHINNKEIGKNPTTVGPISQQSLNANYKSKGRPAAPQKKEWNDSGMTQPTIPQYRVTEDKYASGYVAGLKRQKRLKSYMNQVY